ncbi:unnamed protein product [Schistosoma turkestanicum]|nr:unnamed protein product [Schistosoma turkestanicum]
MTFIARHYSLYVGLFLLFLKRVNKIDLSVCRNAHMVYRVAKHFSQDGFKTLLLNTEKILSEQQQQSDGMLSTEYQQKQTGLWNPVILFAVHTVLNNMMLATFKLQNELIRKWTILYHNGWFNKLTRWLYCHLIFDMNHDEQNNKCLSYLKEGIDLLREFFFMQQTCETVHDFSLKPPQNGRIQWDDLSASPLIMRPHLKLKNSNAKQCNLMNLSSNNSSYSSWNSDLCSMPQLFVNSQNSSRNNAKFTPLDRFQILMGIKRPYIDRQSTNRIYASTMNTFYENRYILIVCNYLEDKLNEKMKPHLIQWCLLSGIRGRIARQLLVPSSFVNQFDCERFLQTNNPRISFRFLADYYGLLPVFGLYHEKVVQS